MVDLKETLENAKTIAVVGCSDRPSRTSYAISRYLKEVGYHILPVNPNCDTCHDERAYDRVQDIPDDVHLDIVNIFRNRRYTADMVRDVIARVERTGERPVIWTQIGVSSGEAEALAKEAGLPYVADRCILVEHGRLSK